MDLAYSLVIAALCGDIEAAPSPDGAGFARTRAADKISRLLRLRVASRSAEHIRRPALSPLALTVQELRSLYSNTRDRRKPAAIIVAPPWPNTGSSNVFAAQAAAHKNFGHEVLLVLGPLDSSSERHQEIRDVEIEMHYDSISSVVYGRTSDTMKPYRSRSFLDWILAGRDDSLSIRSRYAARSRWQAGISGFIDSHQVDVIHVNHAFEMLLGIRIRELVVRRTGKTPRLICNTHDVQAKTYAERDEKNPFNGRKEKYSDLLKSELSLYTAADILTHCSTSDTKFFQTNLPNSRHILITPCLNLQQEKELYKIRAHDYEKHFDFIYVGNNNFANFTAVKWLLTEVFPLLNGASPRIALVGRIKELMRHMDKRLYEKYKHYFVGVVPDIGVYYSISNTVLAPSLVGTGCSVKFMEALCAGKTVIATADSLRGLPDHVGERCAEFVHDTPREFAEAMMMTLGRRLGDNHNAGSIYDDYFHSKHYIARMTDVFTEILEPAENEANRSGSSA
jgi:glycosyltransferase involved in cell wall biosynthesis